jgi:hypothetical protein
LTGQVCQSCLLSLMCLLLAGSQTQVFWPHSLGPHCSCSLQWNVTQYITNTILLSHLGKESIVECKYFKRQGNNFWIFVCKTSSLWQFKELQFNTLNTVFSIFAIFWSNDLEQRGKFCLLEVYEAISVTVCSLNGFELFIFWVEYLLCADSFVLHYTS